MIGQTLGIASQPHCCEQRANSQSQEETWVTGGSTCIHPKLDEFWKFSENSSNLESTPVPNQRLLGPQRFLVLQYPNFLDSTFFISGKFIICVESYDLEFRFQNLDIFQKNSLLICVISFVVQNLDSSPKVKYIELPGVGSVLPEEWWKGVNWRPHH